MRAVRTRPAGSARSSRFRRPVATLVRVVTAAGVAAIGMTVAFAGTSSAATTAWPTPSGTSTVTATKQISGTFAATTASASANRAGSPAPSRSPSPPPRSVNDYTCRPTRPHPYPVVLIHGTLEDSSMWNAFAPTLLSKGYCVFAIDYGNNGTGEIAASAQQLATFVDTVRRATHAFKVDLVGHSQGGMMPRYYMKFLGGARYVHQLIGISPSNYGTTVPTPPNLDCTACHEQAQGSDFLKSLNASRDTVPGVFFTVIATTKDEVVMPYTNTFLKGPGAVNIVIQNVCAADASGHIALAASDQNTWQLVYRALDPRHAAPIHCVAATDPV